MLNPHAWPLQGWEAERGSATVFFITFATVQVDLNHSLYTKFIVLLLLVSVNCSLGLPSEGVAKLMKFTVVIKTSQNYGTVNHRLKTLQIA